MRLASKRRVVDSLAMLGGALIAVSSASAQVIERHLPPPLAPTAPALPAPPSPSSSEDRTPLGPPLGAIILLGSLDPVVAESPAPGIDTHRVPRLEPARARHSLAAFLGRPASRKLISEVEATVVQDYRRAGFPLVEVSTPEQEIDRGVLQIRVIEFRLGRVVVSGASPRQAERIRRGLRLASGGAIPNARLSQDLDWLDRYPFRTIQPAFSPGAALGETDLDLAVAQSRPFSLDAGYANSGSSPADPSRFFVGGAVGGLLAPDSVTLVQVTGSPDFWLSRGVPLGERHPVYQSAAARFLAPIAARQDIELSLDAVETNTPVQAFVVREQTLEAAIGWRGALSTIVPLPGDLSLGVEARHQLRLTFFGSAAVTEQSENVYQIYAGWSWRWRDRLGSTSLDFTVHAAPGGLDRLNSDQNVRAFTKGRVGSASYVYGDLVLKRSTPLPRGFSLSTDLIGQYAGRALPDTEEIGLGGQALVRGYYLDSGAFDDGLVLRDTLFAPALPRLGSGRLRAAMAPYAFLDFGWGRNEAVGASVTIASVGLGANVQINKAISADLALSFPLAAAATTRSGDARLVAKVIVSY